MSDHVEAGVRASSIKWLRVNDEPFEYAIQQGQHGDEFVKLLDGTCLRRDHKSMPAASMKTSSEYGGGPANLSVAKEGESHSAACRRYPGLGQHDGKAQDCSDPSETLETLQSASHSPAGNGWHPMNELPDIGRKFICLYNDGSGAVMFWRHDAGYIDQDGEDCHLDPKQYDRWSYLPDDLEFYCEIRGEDPMTLALPSTEGDRHG